MFDGLVCSAVFRVATGFSSRASQHFFARVWYYFHVRCVYSCCAAVAVLLFAAGCRCCSPSCTFHRTCYSYMYTVNAHFYDERTNVLLYEYTAWQYSRFCAASDLHLLTNAGMRGVSSEHQPASANPPLPHEILSRTSFSAH